MKPFRIGLAMAGAVSAGAYTAGVLDFLVQALDAWSKAKQLGYDSDGNQVPGHEVSLAAVSGASAGSLCAAQLAVMLPYRYRHGSPKAATGDESAHSDSELPWSPLYKGWVTQIDIEKLLEPEGDKVGEALPSLLNATAIDRIVIDSLSFSGPPIERPWVAQPLVIRMTVGNLRGVPYAVPTKGTLNEAEAMTEHADHMGFVLSANALSEPLASLLADHRPMPPHNTVRSPQDDPVWQSVTAAARASSAFPLALPAIKLSRPVSDYNYRHEVETKTGTHSTSSNRAEQNKKVIGIVPGWDQKDAPDPYEFVCVDGGVFNNEPFRLAHSALLLGTDRDSNPRGGKEADSAVVMIAPFNSSAAVPKAFKTTPIESVVMKLLNAWLKQARFKPEDLALAQLPDVFSRFLIAPDRDAVPSADNPHPEPLASGGLQGFFGFFHESFREHDFQLGRRNCQQFLRKHFAVPPDNMCIGSGFSHLNADLYRTKSGDLPIIPLMPELTTEIPRPDWPRGKLDVAALRPLLAARLDVVWGHYRERMLGNADGWWSRKALQAWLWAGWKFGRGRALDFLIGKLKKELETQQLLA